MNRHPTHTGEEGTSKNNPIANFVAVLHNVSKRKFDDDIPPIGKHTLLSPTRPVEESPDENPGHPGWDILEFVPRCGNLIRRQRRSQERH